MPAWLRKTLIALGTAFLVVFIYGVFDPTLREFVAALFIRFYLLGLNIVVKFTFKKGVVSMATIAWKRIFVVGGFALFKRFWINFFKKNAVDHVVKPLMPHTKKWLAVHFEMFKNQPRWIQFSETTFGMVVIGAAGYFFGAITYVWTLVEKVLTGKLQSFFLSVLGIITGAIQFVWSKIQPWIDVIIFSALIEMAAKIPGVKAVFHKTKKVKDVVVEKKDQAIKAAVHKPVQSMADLINRHADEKIKQNGKNSLGPKGKVEELIVEIR